MRTSESEIRLTFSTKNISNNTAGGFGSEDPQISSQSDNVYVVWEDRALVGNNDIFFSFSHDSGQTFSTPPDNLSNSTGRSENPQISSTTETTTTTKHKQHFYYYR
jgi:hypothetical protein